MLLEIAKDEFGAPSHLVVRKTNTAFDEHFKVNSAELKDHQANDVFPKIFSNSFDWNKQFLNGEENHFSFFHNALNRHFEVDTLKIADDQVVGLFVDVTVNHCMFPVCEKTNHRYQVLLDAISDLFFILDKDGVYIDFVYKASDFIQIKPEDILGNSIFEVGFSKEMSAKMYENIQNCIASQRIDMFEYAMEIEDSTAIFEMRMERLNDHSVILLARDITKRKMAEIRAEEEKLKAEESDRLKIAFLSSISHEIRTPMNAIIGFSRMIGSSEFDEEEKSKFIDIIITNGKLLLALINDMISLSQIESNTLVVKKSCCRVNAIMDNLFKEFNYDLEDKRKVSIKLNCGNSDPKFIITSDPALLQSSLHKLIDNGIKFTEDGEVEFGYKVLESNHVEFFVRDTGIGIAEADQERIFERFHQLDSRSIRAYEGTGLGLSITQHFVRLLGGNLSVSSVPGEGSTFSFTI